MSPLTLEMLSIHVVLAELQRHHEWKALAILRMASLRFFVGLANYARIRISPRQYIWRSLKTSNEQAAVHLGRRLLFQLEHRADQNLPPNSKSFSAVIDDYIRNRERDHRHGGTSAGMLRQIIRVAKFWRECAGELAVEAIDDKVMRESVATGLLCGLQEIAEERQAASHRQDASVGHDAWQGHRKMGS